MNCSLFRLFLWFLVLFGSGAHASIPRLALQYWQAGDYPGRTFGHVGPVWVDGHDEDNGDGSGHWEDQDGDGQDDTWVNDTHWVDGHYEDQYIVEGTWPDGALGSSWSTSYGTYNIFSPSSTGGGPRGAVGAIINTNDQFTFVAYGYSPDNSWHTLSSDNLYSLVIYRPNGVPLPIGPGGRRFFSGQFATTSQTFTPTENGWWGIQVCCHQGINDPAYASVSYDLWVGPRTQTITFPAIARHAVGDSAFAPPATASSGLPVALSIVSGPATISDGLVTVTGDGTVVVRAAQVGGTYNGALWNPAASVDQSFTVSGSSQTISFAAIAAHAHGDAPFSLSATATSGLPVTLAVTSGPATLSGGTVTLTGGGNVTITATQPGNAAYAQAPAVSRTFAVAPDTLSPSVPTNLVVSSVYLGSIALSWAPSTDNVGVAAYEVQRNGVVVGTTTSPAFEITGLTSATTYSVAVRARDSSGNWSALTAPVTATTLTYRPPRLALQYWQSGDYPNRPYGHIDHIWVDGHDDDNDDGSGHFEDTDGDGVGDDWKPDTHWVDGYYYDNWVQDGTYADGQYGSLWSTTNGTYNVNDASSSAAITDRGFLLTTGYGPIAVRLWYDAPDFNCYKYTIGWDSSPFNWINGVNTWTTNFGGHYLDWQFYPNITSQSRILAQYVDATNITPATGQVSYYMMVGAPQTISFPSVPNHATGDAPFQLSATSDSGMAVSFMVVSGPATVSGSTVTLNPGGDGTVVVRAYQIGGSSLGTPWGPAYVDRSFIVHGSPQSITFPSIADRAFGSSSVTLAATASSGLPVTYTVSGPATLSGNVLTSTGVGTVSVVAAQVGGGAYGPAPSVTRSFVVTKGPQTITFPPIANHLYGDAPFALSASSSSGLALIYTVSGPASVSGNMLTLTGIGAVTVTAMQTGGTNYNAAASVSQGFASGRVAGYFYATIVGGTSDIVGGPPGTVIHLSAPGPSGGVGFIRWSVTSGAGTIDTPDSNQALLTLGGSDVAVTATTAPWHTITVRNGSVALAGGGVSATFSGPEGKEIDLTAGADSGGQYFSRWIMANGVGGIATPDQRSTRFTIGQNDATVMAKYNITHTLSVGNGTGTTISSGGVEGTTIELIPTGPSSSGLLFDGWQVIGPSGMITTDSQGKFYFVMGDTDGFVMAWYAPEVYVKNYEVFSTITSSAATAFVGESYSLSASGTTKSTDRVRDAMVDVTIEKSADLGSYWTPLAGVSHTTSDYDLVKASGTDSSAVPRTMYYRATSHGNVSGQYFTSLKSYARTVVMSPGSLQALNGKINGNSGVYVGSPETMVTIDAVVPEGNIFTKWRLVTGVGAFGDANSAHTTFKLSQGGAVIQAEYLTAYEITVEGGTATPAVGIMGDVIHITANAGAFSGWTFNGVNETAGVIADPSNPSTTFTMGNRPVTIRANFQGATEQNLWVIGGTISPVSGFKGLPGTTVTIIADPLSHYFFDGWRFIGVPHGQIGDMSSRVTTYTYGLGDARIEPNYTGGGTLQVINGFAEKDGGAPGAVLAIHALVPVGNRFVKWIRNSAASTGSIVDDTMANSSYTMGTGDASITATYELLKDPPVITATSASATVGQSLNYSIPATNMGAVGSSFDVSGLPAGLALNSSTGVLSGKPLKAGVANLVVTATNAGGSDTKTIVLTVAKGSQAISFVQPGNKKVGGAPFLLSATASSGLKPTFTLVSGPVTIGGADGNLVSLGSTTGEVEIRASVAGNADYLAAPDVTRYFSVTNASGTPVHPLITNQTSTNDADNDGLSDYAQAMLVPGEKIGASIGNSATSAWPAVNSNKTEAVGKTAGGLSVDATGAATYAIPIYTPPGVSGVQPALALHYSSSGVNGLLGVGWSLSGISSITRGPSSQGLYPNDDPVTDAVNFSSSDRFFLDGNRLMVVNGSYGDDGSEYRTVEESFAKIVYHSADGATSSWFEMWTKAGVRLEFGKTADSRAAAGTDRNGNAIEGIQTWFLNRAEDREGNYYTVAFSSTTGVVDHYPYPDEIQYTGTSAAAPFQVIKFRYEDRTDRIRRNEQGSGLVYLPHRLSGIDVSYLATAAEITGGAQSTTYQRRYNLEYEVSDFSRRSRLKFVQEEGLNGTKLPKTEFKWSTDTLGFAQVATGSLGDAADVVVFGDFNGDGRTDMFRRTGTVGNGRGVVGLSNGAGFTESPQIFLHEAPAGGDHHNGYDAAIFAGDFNGDGFTDVLEVSVDATDHRMARYLWLGTKDGLSSTAINDMGSSTAFVTLPSGTYNDRDKITYVPRYFVLDSDSSARADLLEIQDYINAPTKFDILRYDGTSQHFVSILPESKRGTNLLNSVDDLRLADRNGDGILELMDFSTRPSAGGYWGFDSLQLYQGKWRQRADTFDNRYSTKTDPNRASDVIYLGDFNGDRMTDVLAFVNRADYTAAVYLSPDEPALLHQSSDWTTSNKLTVVDFDRDGSDDLVRHRETLPTELWASTILSDGTLSFESRGTIVNGPKTNEVCIPIDIDGDGRLDLFIRGDFNSNNNVAPHNNTSTAWRLLKAISSANPTDLITGVVDGFGSETTVAYSTLTDSTVYTKGAEPAPSGMLNVKFPVSVVKTITVDAGPATTVGASGSLQTADATATVSYKYEGLRTAPYRGVLGFSAVESTDSRTGLTLRTERRQDYPYIGFVSKSTVRKGTVTLAETVSEPFPVYLNGGRTYFTYPITSTAKKWGINSDFTAQGSLLSEIRSDQQIDDWGTVTYNLLDYNFEGRTVTTTVTPVAADTLNGKWLVGLIDTVTVTAEATDLVTRVNSVKYSYEDATKPWRVTKAVGDTTPTSAATRLTSTYGYTDTFGHVNTVTVTGQRDGDSTHQQTRSVEYRYDVRGRFVTEVETKLPAVVAPAANPRGEVDFLETFVPDNLHAAIGSHKDANNIQAQMTYDDFGRLSSTVSQGVTTEVKRNWTTDPQGLISIETSAKFADGSSTRSLVPSALSVLDRLGRVQRSGTLNADGHPAWVETRYDSRGFAAFFSQPWRQLPADSDFSLEPDYDEQGHARMYWTQLTFDGIGRFQQRVNPNQSTLTLSYKDSARETTATVVGKNTAGADVTRSRRTVFDAAGRVTSIYNNEGLGQAAERDILSYSYDAAGNVSAATAAGVTMSTEYDYRGLPISSDDPNVGHRDYSYNAFGELYKTTDAKNQVVSILYDALGRIESRTQAEGTTSWTYDGAPGATPSGAKGLVHLVTGPDGASGVATTRYEYDALTRVSKVTRTIAGADFATVPGYDAGSRVESVRYESPGSQVQSFKNVRNDLGYVRELRDMNAGSGFANGQILWALQSVNAAGLPAREFFGNGTRSWSAYSQTDNLLRRRMVYSDALYFENFVLDVDGFGLVGARRAKDAADNDVMVEKFTNDLLGRLTQVDKGSATTSSLEYASGGNISTKSGVGTYAYESVRVAAAGATPAKLRPNAVSLVTLGGSSTSFDYDANGNMTSRNGTTAATWTSFDQPKRLTRGSAWSDFRYDTDGERTQQTTSAGQTTTYVSDVHEYLQGSANVYRYHLPGLAEIRVTGGQRDVKFIATDHLGSVEAVVDDRGALVEGLAYDAWGRRRQANWTDGTPTRQSTVARGFTGHEMLDDLGYVHMRGRVYDPAIGRFLRADPIIASAASAQSYNPYSYVENSPLNGTDPSGYQAILVGSDGFYSDGGRGDGFSGMNVYGGGLGGPSSLSLLSLSFNTGGLSNIGSVPYFGPIPLGNLPVGGGQSGGFVQGHFNTSALFIGNKTAAGGGIRRHMGVAGLSDSQVAAAQDAGFADWLLSTLIDVGHMLALSGDGNATSATMDPVATAERNSMISAGAADLHRSAHQFVTKAYGLDSHSYETALVRQSATGEVELFTAFVGFAGLFENVALRSVNLGSEVGTFSNAREAKVFNPADFATDVARLRAESAARYGPGDGITAMFRDAVRFHHPWPKYLGGKVQQILEALPKSVHDAYHSGLDKILPRQVGTAHYERLSAQANVQALRDLGAYTKAFDAKNGTYLYEAMVREGFPY